MVNKAILVGRMGRDPESRTTSGGQDVCNFSIATDESYKNKAGEKVSKAEWHNIVVWGKLAGIVSQYGAKGKLVYVEGRLQTREWTDKEGNKKRTTEIVAYTFKLLSAKEKEEESPRAADGRIIDDDIPF
jgi:single-strand DNA-binding protein